MYDKYGGQTLQEILLLGDDNVQGRHLNLLDLWSLTKYISMVTSYYRSEVWEPYSDL